MNILWVAVAPGSLRGGAAVRQYRLLSHAARTHRVTLVCLAQRAEMESVHALRLGGIDVIAEPFEPPAAAGRWQRRAASWAQLAFDRAPHLAHTYRVEALRGHVTRLTAERTADLCLCDQLFTAPLMEHAGGLPCVLDEHNVESTNALRQAVLAPSAMRRLWGRIDAWKLARWERRWVRRATVVTAVSVKDAEALQAMRPARPVVTVPNGVDSVSFQPPEDNARSPSNVVFVGNLAYAPNGDAVRQFIGAIWPQVLQRVPDATLTIVGGGPSGASVRPGERVEFTGFVPDVRPYLWRATLTIAPLRAGGGTRFKILEAIAAGSAVVSTTIGAEGLDLRASDEIAIADAPGDFAETVAVLLRDRSARDTLAARGQDAIRARYDWSQIAPRMDEAMRLALAGHTE